MLTRITLALALLLATPFARAQETFNPPDLDGCQTLMSYIWVNIAPGETWQATVDLRNCASTDLGLFMYYGYIASPNKSTVIRSGDGVLLTIADISSGDLTSSKGIRGNLYLPIEIHQPTQILLTAENTGHKTVNIRLTWKLVG